MIVVGRAELRQIVDAAEAAYPGECCGLLIGIQHKNGVHEVKRVAASRNLGKARDRFEIDPQLWVDVTRAHRAGPTRVVGLYHSHPDGPAQPSAVDLEAAWGEELVWLIVSVAGDAEKGAQAVHVTAHMLDHGGRQFREVALRTGDWHVNYTRALPEDTKEPAS